MHEPGRRRVRDFPSAEVLGSGKKNGIENTTSDISHLAALLMKSENTQTLDFSLFSQT